MTERKIQDILWCQYVTGNHILAVPNSGVLGWEADLITVTKAMIMSEFEIKITKADLKADLKKSKHEHIKNYISGIREKRHSHFTQLTVNIYPPANYFWYVVPNKMLGEYQHSFESAYRKNYYSTEEIAEKSGITLPEYAGLMEVEDNIIWIIKKPARLHKEHLTPKQQIQLGRALMYKFWFYRLTVPQSKKELSEAKYGLEDV